MPKTVTHNAVIMRPPPGTRFSIYGSDVELQFERGREREVLTFLQDWLDLYVASEVITAERQAASAAAATANPMIIGETQQGQPGITQSEQKLAAMGLPPTPPQDNHIILNTHPNQPLHPVVGGPVVYGPNGPMTPQEIAQLSDKPIPGVGYVAPGEKPKS